MGREHGCPTPVSFRIPAFAGLHYLLKTASRHGQWTRVVCTELPWTRPVLMSATAVSHPLHRARWQWLLVVTTRGLLWRLLHSFSPGSKPSCFTNPSHHHRLSSSHRTASTPTINRTVSSELIGFCFSSFPYFSVFFWGGMGFHAVE